MNGNPESLYYEIARVFQALQVGRICGSEIYADKCMKHLTFLDYALEAMRKSTQADLQVKAKEI